MDNAKKNMTQYVALFFRNLFSHSYSIAEYKTVLQNPLILKLVTADSISALGNKITYFALLKKVYEISGGNVVDLGFLTLTQIFPCILLGPFAGVLADRISRRKVLIIADVCNGLAILTLIFTNNLEAIFAVAFIAACFYTFRAPAQQAFEPNLVAKEDIPLLNSFKSFSNSFVSITGLALGAAVVAFSGVTISFIIDATSFFISAVIIANIEMCEQHLEKLGNSIKLAKSAHFKHELRQLRSEIKAGVALIRDNATLKLLLVLDMMISFLFGMQSMLYYVFIHETLHMGDKAELAWGTIMSCLGIGSIIGSVIIGMMIRHYPNRMKLFLNVLIFDGFVLAVFSLNTFFPLTIIISLLLGVICAAPLILLNTILQETVADQNRGKVFSFFSIISSPMTVLSVTTGTAVAKFATAQGALLLFALLEIAVAVAILLSDTYRGINQSIEEVVLLKETESTIAAQAEPEA